MNIRILIVAALAALGGGAAQAEKTDLTIAIQLEPPHLDPTSAAAGAIDSVLYSNVFEGLTRFASDGSVIPGLAASWDVSDGGKTYTFHLHDGVKFHDGTPMTGADVKFSLDRARGPDSVNAQKPLFAGITDVAVPDPLTVVVTLDQPNGSFPFNIAWGDAVIVEQANVADEAIKQHPVGTGAFRFVDWVQGDKIDLEKNPDYWGTPARLDHVTFRFISDPTAAFGAMMAGDLDAFAGYPAPENLPQFQADPRFQVIVGNTEGETILAMNNRRPPLDNVKVREAIAHAIDRKAVIDGAMFGYGTPIGTHFAPHNPAYVDLTSLSAYDPERSKALLKEAGVSNLTLSLKLPPPSYARRGGEIIASELRAVGIETRIENLEWAQWLETVFKGKDFDLTIVSHTEPMDFNIYANPDYYFQYDNPTYQALLKTLDATSDPAARTKIMQEAQTIIAKDFVNAWLFELAFPTVAKVGLMGLWKDAPTQATDLTAVYWAK